MTNKAFVVPVFETTFDSEREKYPKTVEELLIEWKNGTVSYISNIQPTISTITASTNRKAR